MQLSGGQRLRVAAARALAGTPELLLIDHISSGLDDDIEAEFWRRLDMRTDTAVLIVSSRPHVIAAADEVILLRYGVVVAQGSPGVLMRESDELRELLDVEEAPR